MKKLVLTIVCAMAALGAMASDAGYAEKMVASHGKEWSQDKKWDYVSGLVAKSILKYCNQYPDRELAATSYKWCKEYADKAIDADGNFTSFKKGSLDNIASGKILLDLYRHELAEGGDGSRYSKAAKYLFDYMRFEYTRISMAGAEGCFIHKNSYPYQMWLDGLYMGAAFYAEYLDMFAPDDVDGWSDIANQFITIHIHTYDEDKHLNYHAWSAKPDDPDSFWANRTAPHKGCSKEFWGRGMGWYFAALADVVEVMPQSHPDYADIVDIYREVASGISEYQDKESGVWYQLLQYDDSYTSAKGTRNYHEASASCMFTYGLLKGMRLGILDREVYGAIAEKAYEGILKTFISESNGSIDIHRICKSAGLGPGKDPGRDGTADYYLDGRDVVVVSNEGKGIGSFIMASLEYERLKGSSVAIVAPESSPRVYYDLQGRRVQTLTLGEVYVTSNGKKIIP